MHGYEIGECLGCRHRFLTQELDRTHVARVYGDDYFSGGGAGYPDYLALGDAVAAHGRYYAAIMGRHAVPGRVLDVGAAAGFLLKAFDEHGWSCTGLEPNAGMAAFGRDELGLDLRVGTLEDFADGEPFDLVCLIQVIGHFYDLPRAMMSLSRLVKPGGHCLVEYWDRNGLPARIMGKAWHEYSPPSVAHWFAAADLDMLLGRTDLRPLARGTPKKYIMGSHAKSLLAYKVEGWPLGRALKRAAEVIPDRARLPYPALDLAWTLFRKAA